MPSDFNLWFVQGLQHILNVSSLDHILYITLLSIAFPFNQIKKIITLATAFTIGHSITLILVSFQILNINQHLVEIVIPITIAITAIINILPNKKNINSSIFLYLLALFFGFIHGMAFGANAIGSLYDGKDVLWLVFAFNSGIEIAQLLIILIILLISFILIKFNFLKYRNYKIILSSIILVFSIYLIIKNIF